MKLIITKNETKNSKMNRYVNNLKRQLAIMSIGKNKKEYSQQIKDVKMQLSNPDLWYRSSVIEIIK
jgi:phosphoribosylamine-glycine ligase